MDVMVEWYILMLIPIALGTIVAITEKKALMKEHAMELSTVFALMIAGLSLILLPFADFSFPTYYWLIIYIASVFGAVAFLFIAKAVRHLELSKSSPLFTFNPVITAVLAWLILKENLGTSQIIGIIIIFAGSYFLEMKPKKSYIKELLTPFKAMIKSKYVHFMLFAMFLYSLTALIDRYLLNSANAGAINPFSYIIIIHFFIAINMLAMIHIFHDGWKGIKHGFKSAGGWIFLMAVALFASRSVQTYVVSLPAAKIALVTAMKRGSTVFTTILGGEIFHDKHLLQRSLAALGMVIGAIIMVI